MELFRILFVVFIIELDEIIGSFDVDAVTSLGEALASLFRIVAISCEVILAKAR